MSTITIDCHDIKSKKSVDGLIILEAKKGRYPIIEDANSEFLNRYDIKSPKKKIFLELIKCKNGLYRVSEDYADYFKAISPKYKKVSSIKEEKCSVFESIDSLIFLTTKIITLVSIINTIFLSNFESWVLDMEIWPIYVGMAFISSFLSIIGAIFLFCKDEDLFYDINDKPKMVIKYTINFITAVIGTIILIVIMYYLKPYCAVLTIIGCVGFSLKTLLWLIIAITKSYMM
jgi:hypothetical protein